MGLVKKCSKFSQWFSSVSKRTKLNYVWFATNWPRSLRKATCYDKLLNEGARTKGVILSCYYLSIVIWQFSPWRHEIRKTTKNLKEDQVANNLEVNHSIHQYIFSDVAFSILIKQRFKFLSFFFSNANAVLWCVTCCHWLTTMVTVSVYTRAVITW